MSAGTARGERLMCYKNRGATSPFSSAIRTPPRRRLFVGLTEGILDRVAVGGVARIRGYRCDATI